MFNANYYEQDSIAYRWNLHVHQQSLPKCAKCGESCCTEYVLGAEYQACAFCGEFGTPAVTIDGQILCWDKCE